MVLETNKLNNLDDQTLGFNPEAKPEVFLSAIENDAPSEDFAAGGVSYRSPSKAPNFGPIAQGYDSGYLANTDAMAATQAVSGAPTYTHIIKPALVTQMSLTQVQIEQIQLYGSQGKLSELRQYLKDLTSQMQVTLSSMTGTSPSVQMARAKLEASISVCDQLGALDNSMLVGTLFNVADGVDPIDPGSSPQYNPLLLIDNVISADVTSAIQSLGLDSNYYEIFYAEVLSDLLAGKLYITTEQRNRLEQLANAGNETELLAYIDQLITSLETEIAPMNAEPVTYETNTYSIKSNIANNLYLTADQKAQVESYANNGQWSELSAYFTSIANTLQGQLNTGGYNGPAQAATKAKMEATIDLFQQCASLTPAQLESNLLTKTVTVTVVGTDYTTPYWQAIKAKMENSINIFQQLKTMSQEDRHKYLFKKVATNYWIMKTDELENAAERILFGANMQKLITALAQANTDSYNAVLQIMTQQTGYEKMNIEKLNSKQAESLNNFVNARKKEIAELVNNHNQAEKTRQQNDAAEMQKQETNLVLSIIASVITFLVGFLAMIFSAGVAAPLVTSVITTTFQIYEVDRKANTDIEIKKRNEQIEEQLTMLRAAEEKQKRVHLERKRADLQRLQKEAQDNKEYNDLLDLQIKQISSVLNSNNLSFTGNNYEQFNTNNYLNNAMLVQGLVSAYRFIAQIKRAERASRDNVAAELSLPGTTSQTSDSTLNAEATDLLDNLNSLADTQFKRAQSHNAMRRAQEEIKKLSLGKTFQVMGLMANQLLDLFTFGQGSAFLKGIAFSTGSQAYTWLTTSWVNSQYQLDDSTPQELNYRNLDAYYAQVFGQIGSLREQVTENTAVLNYEAYLKVLKQFESVYLMNSYISAIQKSANRSIVHQAMTDVRGSAPDVTLADINNQQNQVLLKEIMEKQVYLTNQQIQTTNQKIQLDRETASSGWNVVIGALTGALSGFGNLPANSKKIEGLFASLAAAGLNAEKEDLFDLFNSDSDLKIRTKNVNGDYYVTNAQGQTTVDPQKLLEQYRQFQRAMLIDQALRSIQQANYKAREAVHQEMFGQAAYVSDINKRRTGIVQEEFDGQWSVVTEDLTSTAELLTRRSVRENQVSRNLLTTVLSTATGALVFSGYNDVGFASGISQTVNMSLQTGFAISDISDRTMQETLTFGQEIIDANRNLSDELQTKRIEEVENELLLQAMQLKQNQGLFGMSGVNLSALEHVQYLLRRISEVKQKIQEIHDEESNSRSSIRAALGSVSVELEGIAKAVDQQNNQFLQNVLNQTRRAAYERIQNQNQRQQRAFSAGMNALDSSVNIARSVSPLAMSNSPDTAGAFLSSLQQFAPVLKASLAFGSVGSQSLSTDLSGVVSQSEAYALQAAQYQEQIDLIQTQNPLFDNARQLLQQAMQSISGMINKRANEDFITSKLDNILAEEILAEARDKYECLNAQQKTKQNNLTELWQKLRGNSFYESHLKKAFELTQQGKLSEALDYLEKSCNQNFFASVNPELFGAQDQAAVKDIKTLLTDLIAGAKGLTEIAQQMQNTTALAAQEINELNSALERMTEEYKAFLALQKKYPDQAKLLANPAGFKEYFAAYQKCQQTAKVIAKLHKNKPKLQEILSGHLQYLKNYGGNEEVYQAIMYASMVLAGERKTQDEQYHDEFWRSMYALQEKYQPSTDNVAALWQGYFAERERTGATEAEYAELKKRYELAAQDVSELERLFAANSEDREINFAVANLSQELKLYIAQVNGSSQIFTAERRARIQEYVWRKRQNLELGLMDKQNDLDFTVNVLDRDWRELMDLQEEYNKTFFEYEQKTTTGDPKLGAVAERLSNLHKRITEKERAYNAKRQKYLNGFRKGLLEI